MTETFNYIMASFSYLIMKVSNVLFEALFFFLYGD